MIAMLCWFLKRLRGLATFSLFHILLGANLLLSMGEKMVGNKNRAHLEAASAK